MNLRGWKGNLTALAIVQVPLINATKSPGFVLAQEVLTLAWASRRVLISNPGTYKVVIIYGQWKRGLKQFGQQFVGGSGAK